ncbi:MAG: hypothetical protein HYY40_11750 [Bacteroidetes bacterium]|nr:hypothetical protein [Bacteroidota bacterium]
MKEKDKAKELQSPTALPDGSQDYFLLLHSPYPYPYPYPSYLMAHILKVTTFTISFFESSSVIHPYTNNLPQIAQINAEIILKISSAKICVICGKHF